MATQNKKKVLFVITKSNWGGAQRYVYDLTTNLDRSKFDPVVALGGDGVLVSMLENAHVRVIRLSQMSNATSLKNSWKNLRELLKILKIERPAVLHLNSSIAGLLGAIAGRITLVPKIIFTAHGWAFNEDRPWWQKLIIKCLHYLTILLSHRTIAVSTAIVKQMNWPKAQNKMKIINPGRTIGVTYGRSEARSKLISFQPELEPYQNDQWVVCIAELHPIKRHLILLEALRLLPHFDKPVKLILIGEGSERESIESYIGTHNLSNQVFLLGSVTEAARFLKAFDLFVLASKSESYGYVLHEAGLAQVPVIATNVGGIPDIVTNNQTGILVAPDDYPALAKALNTLLVNKTQAATFATALHAELIERSVTKMTRQTESLYQQER